LLMLRQAKYNKTSVMCDSSYCESYSEMFIGSLLDTIFVVAIIHVRLVVAFTLRKVVADSIASYIYAS